MADINFYQGDNDDDSQKAWGLDDQELLEGGFSDVDRQLSPIERLEKYMQSDNVFNRQMVARGILDTLRDVGEVEQDCAAVLQAMMKLSCDPEATVRSELMEQVPHIAMYCQQHRHVFKNAVPNYLLPLVVRYLDDGNNQVRKTSQAALLVLLEQDLVEKADIEEQVVEMIVELAGPESPDDYRTEAVALMSKLAPLLGRDVTVKQFLPRFCEMCQDQLFHVKKVCAANFGDMCTVVGTENSEKYLLPHFVELCNDRVWGVRKACTECFMIVSQICSSAHSKSELTYNFVNLLRDQSRWVRMAAFQALGPVISTFSNTLLTGLAIDDEGMVTYVDPSLLSDPEDKADSDDGEKTPEAPGTPENSFTDDKEDSLDDSEDDIINVIATCDNHATRQDGDTSVPRSPPDQSDIDDSSSKRPDTRDDTGESTNHVVDSCLNTNDERTYSCETGSISSNSSDSGIMDTCAEPQTHVGEVETPSVNIHDVGGDNLAIDDGRTCSGNFTQYIQKSDDLTRGANDLNFGDELLEGSGDKFENFAKELSEHIVGSGDDRLAEIGTGHDSKFEEKKFTELQSDDEVFRDSGDLNSLGSVTPSASGGDTPGDDNPENKFHIHIDNIPSYNTFQFWRSPIPEVGLDMDLVNGMPTNIVIKAKVQDAERHKVYRTEMDVHVSREDDVNATPADVYASPGELPSPEVSIIRQSSEVGGKGVKVHTASVSTVSEFDTAPHFGTTHVLGQKVRTFSSLGASSTNLSFMDSDHASMSGNKDMLNDADISLSQNVIPASLLENYLSMAVPSQAEWVDQEITRHCAYSLPAVAFTLGRANWKCLKHLYDELAADIQWKVRRTLAFSLHGLALILGEDITHTDLVPVFDGFLKDLDEVRIGVLKHLADFIKLLRPEVRNVYLMRVQDFLTTDNARNWRFRLELAEQLVMMCEMFDPEAIADHLLPVAQVLFIDKVSCVRHLACDLIATIFRRLLESPGLEVRLHAFINDLHAQFALSPVWCKRQQFIHVCGALLRREAFPHPQFTSLFLEQLLSLSADRIPNVRITLARTLTSYVLNSEFYTSQDNPHHDMLMDTLTTLQNDSDRDVRLYSTSSPSTPAAMPTNHAASTDDLPV